MSVKWRLNGILPFQAAIFDLNGVIVNDIPFHKQAWYELCELHGVPLSEELFNVKINGRTNREIFEFLYDRSLTDDEVRRYSGEKEERYREIFGPHRKTLPGLTGFLTELKEKRIPTAVATSSPPVNVPFIMEYLNLYAFFDVVLDANDVTRGKPDPEMYLTAASRLGIDSEECLVFEDALLGVKSALAAGMKVVGVSTTHMELEGAAFMIPDYRGLSLRTAPAPTASGT